MLMLGKFSVLFREKKIENFLICRFYIAVDLDCAKQKEKSEKKTIKSVKRMCAYTWS